LPVKGTATAILKVALGTNGVLVAVGGMGVFVGTGVSVGAVVLVGGGIVAVETGGI
jgi:hypothetical protein